MCALWLKTGKDDQKFMIGSAGKMKFLIYKNKHKKADNHPDYILYMDENKQRGGQNTEPGSGSGAPSGGGIPTP